MKLNIQKYPEISVSNLKIKEMVFQTYLLSSKSCIAGWEQEDELSLFLLLIILGLWSKHFWNTKQVIIEYVFYILKIYLTLNILS